MFFDKFQEKKSEVQLPRNSIMLKKKYKLLLDFALNLHKCSSDMYKPHIILLFSYL